MNPSQKMFPSIMYSSYIQYCNTKFIILCNFLIGISF